MGDTTPTRVFIGWVLGLSGLSRVPGEPPPRLGIVAQFCMRFSSVTMLHRLVRPRCRERERERDSPAVENPLARMVGLRARASLFLFSRSSAGGVALGYWQRQLQGTLQRVEQGSEHGLKVRSGGLGVFSLTKLGLGRTYLALATHFSRRGRHSRSPATRPAPCTRYPEF